MHRDRFTAKIERMIGVIEAGKTLVPVRALYVFGSYRRGAIECGDLDLVIVHDPIDDAVYKRLGIHPGDYDASIRITRGMRKPLCNPGERVSIAFTQDFAQWQQCTLVKPEDVLLIWSRDEHESALWPDAKQSWRTRLSSIPPDSSAGRFLRDHFIDLDRTNGTLDEMNELQWLIANERLALERRPLDRMSPRLTADEQRRLAGDRCGQALRKIVPFVIEWFREERKQIIDFGLRSYTEHHSNDGSLRAHLGTIGLRYVTFWMFRRDRPASKVCLIPHLRKKGPNAMLIFTQGAKWTGDDNEYQRRDRHTRA